MWKFRFTAEDYTNSSAYDRELTQIGFWVILSDSVWLRKYYVSLRLTAEKLLSEQAIQEAFPSFHHLTSQPAPLPTFYTGKRSNRDISLS